MLARGLSDSKETLVYDRSLCCLIRFCSRCAGRISFLARSSTALQTGPGIHGNSLGVGGRNLGNDLTLQDPLLVR